MPVQQSYSARFTLAYSIRVRRPQTKINSERISLRIGQLRIWIGSNTNTWVIQIRRTRRKCQTRIQFQFSRYEVIAIISRECHPVVLIADQVAQILIISSRNIILIFGIATRYAQGILAVQAWPIEIFIEILARVQMLQGIDPGGRVAG